MQSQVRPGGVAVLVSPYSWLAAWTPKAKWIGGFKEKVRGRSSNLKHPHKDRGLKAAAIMLLDCRWGSASFILNSNVLFSYHVQGGAEVQSADALTREMTKRGFTLVHQVIWLSVRLCLLANEIVLLAATLSHL